MIDAPGLLIAKVNRTPGTDDGLDELAHLNQAERGSRIGGQCFRQRRGLPVGDLEQGFIVISTVAFAVVLARGRPVALR